MGFPSRTFNLTELEETFLHNCLISFESKHWTGFTLFSVLLLVKKMSLHLEKCLPYLRKSFKIFPWLHCHPYCWIDNTGPVFTASQISRFHWRCNVVLVIAYYCFLVYRSIHVFQDQESSLAMKSYMCFPLLLYSGFVCFPVFVAGKSKEFPTFFAGFMQLLRDRKSFDIFSMQGQ